MTIIIRRHVVAISLSLTMLSCGGGGSGVGPTPVDAPCGPRQDPHCRSLIVNGVTRTFLLHVPLAFHPGAGALVIALHGAGAAGSSFQSFTNLSGKADQAGFAVAYPDGLFDANLGGTNWQHFGNDFTDDVGFLRQLIETIQAELRTDPRRTYLAGHSNGGRLAYRAAVQFSDRVAAIGVVGGSLFNTETGTPAVPAALGPVSVLILHGDAEGYCGTSLVASQEETFNYWAGAMANGCSRVDPAAPLCDSQRSITPVVEKSATGCAGNTEVRLYKLIGGQHTWYTAPMNVPGLSPYNPELHAATGVTTNDIIWNFFAAHPKL